MNHYFAFMKGEAMDEVKSHNAQVSQRAFLGMLDLEIMTNWVQPGTSTIVAPEEFSLSPPFI